MPSLYGKRTVVPKKPAVWTGKLATTKKIKKKIPNMMEDNIIDMQKMMAERDKKLKKMFGR